VRVAVRRHDRVVHSIRCDVNTWGNDREPPTSRAGPKVAWCGLRMKVNAGNRNVLTNEPVNCILCITEELRHER